MQVFIVKRKRPDGKLETLARNGVLACFLEREAADEAAKSIGGFVVPQEADVQKVEEFVMVTDEELRGLNVPPAEVEMEEGLKLCEERRKAILDSIRITPERLRRPFTI